MARGGIEYHNSKNMMEAMTDIRDRLQPWKLSALWRGRGTCYYKVRRDGVIRLFRTSETLGFCWAELRMAQIRGNAGTAMIVRTASTVGLKILTWIVCVISVFMVAHDWVEYGSAVALRDWPYVVLCVVVVLLTWMTSRETPKLLQLLENDLGWRRAR
ncbi:MAG: hypothetical protein ACOX7N_08000 [Lawsonibacter sp.]|jgi:hypothetical protein